MNNKQLRVLVIDDDPFFSTHIEYHCEMNDLECLVLEDIPDVGFRHDCDYILLDDTLVRGFNLTGEPEELDVYRETLESLKISTGNAAIILCSQHELKQALKVPLEEMQYHQAPLLHEVTRKPYDLRKLQSAEPVEDPRSSLTAEELALEASKKLPVAIAIFRFETDLDDEPLWANEEWQKRELNDHDNRLFLFTLHDLKRDYEAGKKGLTREFRFPNTQGDEIVDWYFWVVEEFVYFVRRFQELTEKNNNFSYLDAERDPVRRFKEIRDLLALRYGISRFRVYETDQLRDSFPYKDDAASREPLLMIPRFASGGGVVNETGQYSTRAWLSEEFRQRPGESTSNDIYLDKVSDSPSDSPKQYQGQGCRSIRWGKAQTRAQVVVRDKQGKEWAHISLDQRLDHMRRDKSNGEMRQELRMVLQANPFASSEKEARIGTPPLKKEEVDALLPLLNMLSPAVSRWFKKRRDRALQQWSLVLSRVVRNVLGQNDLEPPQAFNKVFQAMVTTWPLMQGLRLPSRAYIEEIVPDHGSDQEWDSMLFSLHEIAAHTERNAQIPASLEPIPLDEFVAHHSENLGLTNMYIAQQFEEHFFHVISGYGALANKLRKVGEPWKISDPHRHAFEQAQSDSVAPTVIQDYQAWLENCDTPPSGYNTPQWEEERRKIGSWCAVPILRESRSGYPTLLVITSCYENYFSESRVELLERLANHLLPMMRWYEEWRQIDKVRHAVAHGLGDHLGELRDRTQQEDWQGVAALLPLFEGFHGNFKMLRPDSNKPSDSLPNYSTRFGDVLSYLNVLKGHCDYSWVLSDWPTWQELSDARLNIPKSALQQILYNLIVNASRYAVQGSVRLAGTQKGGKLILLMANECKSELTDHDRSYLFVAGYRPPDEIGSGSGLGLAIARELALENGADLKLCANEDPFYTECLTDVVAERRFGLKLVLSLVTSRGQALKE